jgi:hypothetical protein
MRGERFFIDGNKYQYYNFLGFEFILPPQPIVAPGHIPNEHLTNLENR